MSDTVFFSHVTVGTNDIARATRFYDAVLGTLGCTRFTAFTKVGPSKGD